MNNVVLIGRLCANPEMRYIPESQLAVTTFTLAVDRPFSKEKQADFIRITVFGKQAENCEKYLEKGRMVAVQGSIRTGSYKNKEGATVYTTEVNADRVQFLDWGDKKQQDDGVPEGFAVMEDDGLDSDIPF